MLRNNLIDNSWSSLYFTRSIKTQLPPKKEEPVNIDLLPLQEKMTAIRHETIKKEKKASIPGATLLKRLHKQEKKKKKKNINDDNESDTENNIDKYTNSINHIMQTLEI
jgi:hypothetical protein